MMFGIIVGDLSCSIESVSFARIRWQYIVCCSVIALVPFSTAEEFTHVELRREILSHYNKSVAPGFGESPDIGFVLVLSRIRQFDESTGTLTVEGHLYLFWMDTRLSWTDDTKYRNIRRITAMANDIWTPKINVFNSGRAERFSNTDLPIRCTISGKVGRMLVAELHPACEPTDLRWYPTDTHICTLSIGALYPQEIGGLFTGQWKSMMNHGVVRAIEMKHPQWDLLKLEHGHSYVATSNVFYPTDEFTFTIRRQGWHLLAVILPLMTCCIFLSWSSFALPLHEKQLTKRVSIATLSLFLSTVLLLFLIQKVPGVGQKPPIIIKVNVCITVMAFLASLHTVIFSRICRNSKVLLNVLQKLPGPTQYLLGLKKMRSQTPTGGESGLLENSDSPPDSGEERFHMDSNLEDVSGLVETAYDRAHLILQINVLTFAIAFLCVA